MNKPIIAIDCDGVLSDWHKYAFPILNDILKTNYCVHDLDEWNISCLIKDEISSNKFWNTLNSSNMIEELEPYDKSIEAIEKLKTIANIYVVTSPMVDYNNWIIHRNNWLKKYYGFGKNNIVHTSAKYLIKADIFIDDQSNNVEKWVNNNPYRLGVLWAHKYNKNYQVPGSLYTNNWKDIEDIIQQELWIRTNK